MKFGIYGDSIMKMTSFSDGLYKSHFQEFKDRFESVYPIEFINRSRFGSTSGMGLKRLVSDLEQGAEYDAVLVEFGGNDCDYLWEEISNDPDGTYYPKTPRDEFEKNLIEMVRILRERGITPVFMTLPPSYSEGYLAYLEKSGLSSRNIIKWLGDPDMIYRFHELYNTSVCRLSRELDVPLIDVRPVFLDRHEYTKELISPDGIHPTEKGYKLMYDVFDDFFRKISSTQ